MFEIHNATWNRHRNDPHCDPLSDFSGFIHGCSADDLTRSVTAAATVLALGQIGGPLMSPHPPGFLLVNAGGLADDPVDCVTRRLEGFEDPNPPVDAEWLERHRRTMIHQLLVFRQSANSPHLTREMVHAHRLAYMQECRAAFGGMRMGCYARRFDSQLGWVADITNHVALRLASPADHTRFAGDVHAANPNLIDPQGYGETLILEPKRLSVNGSLPVADLRGSLVAGIVNRALPVMFLPHTASAPLKAPEPLRLNMIAIGLENELRAFRHPPVSPCALPNDRWIHSCMARLRTRLISLPKDYDFFIQSRIREVDGWCIRLAGMVAKGQGDQPERSAVLHENLRALVFHGIWLGVEWLGWHGYGFRAGCSRDDVVKLLAAVRGGKDGSIRRRELLRKVQSFTAAKRDEVLERLTTEGLVTLNGEQVSAVTAADYLRSIPARSSIPNPSLRRDGPMKKPKPKAAAK